MTTYNTGNPIGSTAVKDLYDNAENLDVAVNDVTSLTWKDRLGKDRPTLNAALDAVDRTVANANVQISNTTNNANAIIASLGYQVPTDYVAGINLTLANQTVSYDGSVYAPIASELPFTTSGTFEADKFRLIQGLSGGDLAAPYGSAMVGFIQSGTGATARTGQDKMRDIVSVKDFGAVGDGVINDQLAIERAVSAALSNGASLFWPIGQYVSTESIPNFHSVMHIGSGIILRGTNSWHITPTGNQLNIIHLSPSGTSDSDGLDRENGTTILKMNQIVQGLGSKSSDGVWRAQLAEGIYTEDGIMLADWPIFRSPFQFWGETPITDREVRPSVVWQGKPTNNNVYAILAQNISTYLNIDFRYICFEDWQGRDENTPSALAGAIALWCMGLYHVENCWFERTSRGFSFRYGYARVYSSMFIDNITHGVSVSYAGTANIGTVENGNKFIRSGADSGRFSVAYVVGNEFEDCNVCVSAEWMTRINPTDNKFSNWGRSVYRVSGNSLSTESPASNNQYLTPITREKPVWFGTGNSVNRMLHDGPTRTMQQYDNGRYDISGRDGERLLLSTEFGGGYTPFRLPGWTLMSPDWRLDIELRMTIELGAGGTLELAGQGVSETSVLARLVIPAQDSYVGDRTVTISVVPSGAGSARGIITHNSLNISSVKATTLNTTHVTDSSDLLFYRLYFTPASDATVSFGPIRSWFEG